MNENKSNLMVGPTERVKTGIKGLDEILKGGLPRRNSVLLSGSAGSGKTTMALEFLYKGAKEFNQNGIHISFEESVEDLIRNIPFKWNLQDLVDSKKITLMKYDPYQYEDIIDLIRTNIKEINAERIVIDSLSALNLYVEDLKDIRKLIADLMVQLKKLNCTALFTGVIRSETPEKISSFGVEESIADGIIVLNVKTVNNEMKNTLLVRKMRGTNHDKKIHDLKFGDDGIEVII